MKKLAFITGCVVLVLCSCKKYDYSEGEMSTVNPQFIQLDYYSIAPAVDISLTDSYVDSLDTVNYSNGLGDTIPLVISNPYNIPFSFQHDVGAQNFGHLSVYDQNFNLLDKSNLNNNGDTLIVLVDCGSLNIGESKTLDIFVKHQDYLISTKHYTATRQN